MPNVLLLSSQLLVCTISLSFQHQMSGTVITSIGVRDIRFPTSLEQHGSDAMVGAKCNGRVGWWLLLFNVCFVFYAHVEHSTPTPTIRVLT